MDDPDALRKAFNKYMETYIDLESRQTKEIDSNIRKEFQGQAQFLTNSNKKLEYQLTEMQKLYREDKTNIMNKNVGLISDVQALRGIVAAKKRDFAKLGGEK